MIEPKQLIEKINGNKLLIYFENTETIIAEINKDREVILAKEFSESLTKKSLEKIMHIASYYDDGFFVPISLSLSVQINTIDIPIQSEFKRFMNERPKINTNDLCKLTFYLDEKNSGIFRIQEIKALLSSPPISKLKLKGTGAPHVLENVSIDDIVLIKEYHENLYYIQNGYVGNSIYWWALDSKGYTSNIKKAHKFSEQEANSIIDNDSSQKMWECDYIDSNTDAHITVIDMQYLKQK